MDLTALGQSAKVDRYAALAQEPLNMGEIIDARGVGYEGSACGDWVRMWIKLDDAGRILDAKFKAHGCASALASSSALTELAKGRTVDEALQVTAEDVIAILGGLPERKTHCSELSFRAFRNALQACLA